MLENPPAWLPGDDRLRRFLGDSALYPFYRLKLTGYVSSLLPPGPCSILDVGAGDGSLGLVFQTFRPDTTVFGIEVALRAATRQGVRMVRFDGRSIPFLDGSFDVSLVSNVLHHASDPAALLREVRRGRWVGDRKSTRLNSSHGYISYAVFCLKKKKKFPRTA